MTTFSKPSFLPWARIQLSRWHTALVLFNTDELGGADMPFDKEVWSGVATVIRAAMITSRLDDCNVLYVELPFKTIQKLRSVQNSQAIYCLGWLQRYTCWLQVLDWLPICFWMHIKLLGFTFNAPNGLGLGYSKDHHLLPFYPNHYLRSSSLTLLFIPILMRMGGNRAFSLVAPHFWKALLLEARLAPTILSFRHHTKTLFFI